jgi:hypothetical protein
MAFHLDADVVRTEDGLPIGRMGAGSLTLNLSVNGEPEQLLNFARVVAAAYEAIHPPGAFVTITVDADSDTIWTGPELLEEQTARVKGNVIRVHMNDPDNWPSDLHGHLLNRAGQKVDIYTGNIFDIQSRKQIGALGKKDLARVQTDLRKAVWAAAKLDSYQHR